MYAGHPSSSTSCHPKGPGGSNVPPEEAGDRRERKGIYLVACDMHVSGMKYMSWTCMSVYDLAMTWCCLPMICSSSTGHISVGLQRCVSMLHAILFCAASPLSALLYFPLFSMSQRGGDFNFCWFDWIQVELLPKEDSTVIFVWAEIFLSLLRDACNHHPHQIAAWDHRTSETSHIHC